MFVFEDEEFVYTNLLGIKRRFKYSEITKIIRYRGKHSGLIALYGIYIGKREISIDYMASNFSEFERTIKRYTKKAGNRIEIIEKKPFRDKASILSSSTIQSKSRFTSGRVAFAARPR